MQASCNGVSARTTTPIPATPRRCSRSANAADATLDETELAAWTMVVQSGAESRRSPEQVADVAISHASNHATSSTMTQQLHTPPPVPAPSGSHLLGGAASMSLRRLEAMRPGSARRGDCSAALRAEGEARDLPASWSAAPSQMDLFDYKPVMRRVVRQGPARLDPHGPAADDDDQRPGALPDRAVEVQVRPARRDAACG